MLPLQRPKLFSKGQLAKPCKEILLIPPPPRRVLERQRLRRRLQLKMEPTLLTCQCLALL
ncbi:hypothetical protein AHAS_Ahas17G0187900 [Arachis hypogaea]